MDKPGIMDRIFDIIEQLIDNDTIIIIGLLVLCFAAFFVGEQWQPPKYFDVVIGGFIGYIAKTIKDNAANLIQRE